SVGLAIGHFDPPCLSPKSGHQTIAHARGVVSIIRQSLDQRALLDAGANDEENAEHRRDRHAPPGTQTCAYGRISFITGNTTADWAICNAVTCSGTAATGD